MNPDALATALVVMFLVCALAGYAAFVGREEPPEEPSEQWRYED